MSLSDLASIGSFVSGIGVLASLLFLFYQMRQLTEQLRQSERNQQAVIKQGRTARGMDISARLTDASYAEVALKFTTNAQDLTPVDCLRFASHVRSLFQSHEESFSQYRRGLFHEDDFKSLVTNIKWTIQGPHIRVAWRRQREFFAPEFVQFIDGIMDEAPVTPRRLIDVAGWKADLVAEMAKAA